jgi:hypothetical protein
MQVHRQARRKDALVPDERAVTGPAGRYRGNPRSELGQRSTRPGSMTAGRLSRPVRLSAGAGG